jgi:hypothetical protein
MLLCLPVGISQGEALSPIAWSRLVDGSWSRCCLPVAGINEGEALFPIL